MFQLFFVGRIQSFLRGFYYDVITTLLALTRELESLRRKKPMEFLHDPTFMEKFGGGSNMIRGLEESNDTIRKYLDVSGSSNHVDTWQFHTKMYESPVCHLKSSLVRRRSLPTGVLHAVWWWKTSVSLPDESNGHSHRGEVDTWQWKTNHERRCFSYWTWWFSIFDMLVCLPQCTHILEGLKKMHKCNKIYGHFGGGICTTQKCICCGLVFLLGDPC